MSVARPAFYIVLGMGLMTADFLFSNGYVPSLGLLGSVRYMSTELIGLTFDFGWVVFIGTP